VFWRLAVVIVMQNVSKDATFLCLVISVGIVDPSGSTGPPHQEELGRIDYVDCDGDAFDTDAQRGLRVDNSTT
jgi:hypothetical protein